MNTWIAKAVILAASVVMVVIRASHGRRNRGVKVARSCKGPREVALLTLAWMGFLVPLIWVVAPVFSFAEYSLRPWPFGAGVLSLAGGLWLFHRSHANLGMVGSAPALPATGATTTARTANTDGQLGESTSSNERGRRVGAAAQESRAGGLDASLGPIGPQAQS